MMIKILSKTISRKFVIFVSLSFFIVMMLLFFVDTAYADDGGWLECGGTLGDYLSCEGSGTTVFAAIVTSGGAVIGMTTALVLSSLKDVLKSINPYTASGITKSAIATKTTASNAQNTRDQLKDSEQRLEEKQIEQEKARQDVFAEINQIIKSDDMKISPGPSNLKQTFPSDMGSFLDVMDLVCNELMSSNKQDLLLGILKDSLSPDISYDDLSKESLFSGALLFAQNHSQLVVNAIDKYVEIVRQIRSLGESGLFKLIQKLDNNFSTSDAYKNWKKTTEEIGLLEVEIQSLRLML